MDTPETAKKIRVLLAEDHTLVRQGFRRILEDDPQIIVVGEARTGLEAMELCKNLKPEIVVMDLSMPELGGVEVRRGRIPAVGSLKRGVSGTSRGSGELPDVV